MPDVEPRVAPTDRATYCAICLSYCQNGNPWPPAFVQTAGATPPAHCPGWKRNPNCNGYVPVYPT